jgi:Domain of unknown function (DUF4406)
MLIAVAGPYSADTAEQRQQNLDALNTAAAEVMMRGHIPVIGVNAAVPVVSKLPTETDRYEAIMEISLALVDRCDALLLIGESPGANRERHVVSSKGLPVFLDIAEIPPASSRES